MSTRVTDPNQVRLTGENSFITLHADDSESSAATFKASHWRILYSLAGSGHALFLRGNLTGDKAKVYADNEKLARWLQKETKQVGSGESDPVIPAHFTRVGDTTSAWKEMVTSKEEIVVLTWRDLIEPFVFRSGAGERPGIVHGVYSLFVPARSADVTLNGKRAAGRVITQKIDDKTSSSACLALSETWVKPY